MMSIENFEDVHILLTKSLMFYIFQGALGKIENKVEDILNRLDYSFRWQKNLDHSFHNI